LPPPRNVPDLGQKGIKRVKTEILSVVKAKDEPPIASDPSSGVSEWNVEDDNVDDKVNTVPRLTVGLPVYNGERYVAESIEALLGQSYQDFELIISDNASTDGTPAICERYARQDSRIRYYRQPRNIGLAPNHNFCVQQARGELFKWAAGDDLYHRDLLLRCVEALDERPEVVLVHAYTAMIDGDGKMFQANDYALGTSAPHAPERFRSLLNDSGGDDDGGVIRRAVLLRTAMKDSYHHADRTIIAELALHGPFYHVPEWMYFRRDHPGRAERAHPSVRARCANMDPRRANPWRHPVPRLIGEYLWAYVRMIQSAPLTSAERLECYGHLAAWVARRSKPHHLVSSEPPTAETQPIIDVHAVVPGRGAELK
jgi:glycosyltransferase involved in cell wall biosynthesis